MNSTGSMLVAFLLFMLSILWFAGAFFEKPGGRRFFFIGSAIFFVGMVVFVLIAAYMGAR